MVMGMHTGAVGSASSAAGEGSVSSGRHVVKKGSKGSLLLGSGFSNVSRRDREGSAFPVQPTLTEEPASFDDVDPSPPASPRSALPDRSRHPVSDGHDSELDSDDDDASHRDVAPRRGLMTLTPIQKGISKSVIAYLLAECFTFVPFLTDFLGRPWDLDTPVRNAHVVATIAVYFYPARTMGAMVEANLYLVAGLVWAMFLCCGSMAGSVLLDKFELQILGHILVLVFWLCGGYTVLALVKASLNKPTATTACSLVSLICSVIITKEGAYHIGQFQSQAILQILLIVAVGATISNVICFVVWPASATSKLQVDLNATLSSYSTLLELLTKTFLLDEDIRTRPSALKRAIDAHQSSYTTLRNSLAQAKYEIFDPRLASITTYETLIDTMLRLSQGLTALRSGCTLQNDLLRKGLVQSEQLTEASLAKSRSGPQDSDSKKLLGQLVVLEKFKRRVGPSMLALTSTSRRALGHLRTSFVRTKPGKKTLQTLATPQNEDAEDGLSSQNFARLKVDLDSKLLLFRREHSRAIKLLYRAMPADETVYDDHDLEEDLKDQFADPLAAQDSDYELFRLYHFCQNLEQWTEDLSVLVSEFEVVRSTEEQVIRAALGRRKKWGPLAFIANTIEGLRFRGRQRRGRGKRTRATVDQQVLSLWDQFIGAFTSRSVDPFPRIVDGALSSHQLPTSSLNTWGRLKRSIWRFGYHLQQPTTRFALKTGLGAALLAAPAFTRFRPVWLKWRMEWALISFMVVIAPSTGQTNLMSFNRVLFTLVGAATAALSYTIFPENAIILPLLGALVSIPCFYAIITRPQYGPSARFALLSFNLTALYAYNLREVDIDVKKIALQRSLAVSAGVLWSLIVTVWIFPYQARRELRVSLSEWLTNSAHLYLSIVKQYSTPPVALSELHLDQHEHASETTQLLVRHLDRAEAECIQMEIALQEGLIKLQGLLAATAHEPRLKGGRFPIVDYSLVLQSCQTILDLLSSIQHVVTRESWYTTVRRDYVLKVNRERREMVGNILLYFSLLASALSLKTPMPTFLPPARQARRHLLRKLHTLEVVKRRIVRSPESLLYLAYSIQVGDVIKELDNIGKIFQRLFGIVGGASSTEEFEALFVSHEGSGLPSDDEDASSDEGDSA